MKKLILFFSLILFISCLEHDFVNIDEPNYSKSAITFTDYTNNITRSSQRLDKTHTSFGVYGFYSDSSKIMNQYLVKWTSNYISGTDNVHSDTAAVNGQSGWYYDGLNTTNGAVAEQYLKYFDITKPSSTFIGYTPYKTNEFTTYIDSTSTLIYKNVSSFSVGQTLSNTDKSNIDSKEILWSRDNHNSYDSDVLLSFKRGMAKLQIGFKDLIPGYRIQLIDLTNASAGVQLVPADSSQISNNIVQPLKSSRPTWKDNADTYTVETKTGNITVTDNNESNDNIVFSPTNDKKIKYQGDSIFVIAEDAYTMSNTVYYMLPQTNTSLGFTLKVSYRLIPKDGTSDLKVYDARVYIPNTYCKWKEGFIYTYLIKITTASTGNTNPDVNERDMGLKDSNADGDNNPATNPEKYVDVDDPRIPTEKALHPIIFEAVVEDYKENSKDFNLN